MPSNKYINEDTYQTLQEVSIETQSDYEKARTPLWKESDDIYKKYEIFVATPVHSEVSIHYTQALIEFQKLCFKKKLSVSFHLIKSSLVTQGRNLSVAGFLESKATHLLFIDSDIYFQGKSILSMLKADKHVISVPYPLKALMWDKAFKKIQQGRIKTPDDIRRALHTYPMKVPDVNNITLDNGVMEVTDSPTGCMLIKREVIEKMIASYPELYFENDLNLDEEFAKWTYLFFDCMHEPDTKRYLSEDYAFCRRWQALGGEVWLDPLINLDHVGHFTFSGNVGKIFQHDSSIEDDLE